jgi:hypothetical protein
MFKLWRCFQEPLGLIEKGGEREMDFMLKSHSYSHEFED